MLPMEIMSFAKILEVFPTDRRVGGVVSIFQLFEQEFPCFSPFGAQIDPPGQAARNVNSRRARGSWQRLVWRFLDSRLQSYARCDRSSPVGGGRRHQAPAVADPPRDQSLAERPGHHCPGRRSGLPGAVRPRAGAGRGHPANRLRQRSAGEHRPQPPDADAARAAHPSLHRTRRARQRAVGGQSAQMWREGLLAARAHHPRLRCSRRSPRRAPSSARRRMAAEALLTPANDAPSIRVPGYTHRQGNRHQQFLLGVPRAQRAAAAQRRAQSHEPRHLAAGIGRCRALPARIRDHLEHRASRHRGDLRLRCAAAASVPRHGVHPLRRFARPAAQPHEHRREPVLPAHASPRRCASSTCSASCIAISSPRTSCCARTILRC